MARVFVAMSGGVDSSVAAALLLEQGHDVTGVTMQLWPSSDEDGGCCSVSAARDARRVCDLLGIAHYSLNYRDTFEREVVTPFARAYAQGRTPNPCIACNDRVKFSDLLARVSAQGAEFLATGHYARLAIDPRGERRLARGTDAAKDQSYFLYRLSPAQMEHVLFPVGELHKPEVRACAERLGLPVARKAESQDICFDTGAGHESVVRSRARDAFVPGAITLADGTEVGTHAGIGHFTVGQRKGLGIGGLEDPYYVIGIDAPTARVIVGPRDALRVRSVTADEVVWHGQHTEEVEAVVRYRMTPVPARATVIDGRLTVEFSRELDAIAPGQAVVCYRGDVVVGGGTISCVS